MDQEIKRNPGGLDNYTGTDPGMKRNPGGLDTYTGVDPGKFLGVLIPIQGWIQGCRGILGVLIHIHTQGRLRGTLGVLILIQEWIQGCRGSLIPVISAVLLVYKHFIYKSFFWGNIGTIYLIDMTFYVLFLIYGDQYY